MRRPVNYGQIAICAVSWLLLLGVINFFAPRELFPFILFYILAFTSLFSTFFLFFRLWRSILWSCVAILFLFLRQTQVDSVLNIALLLTVAVSIELYFRKG